MTREARLRELEEAIQRAPAEPASYLLRGELLLERNRRGDDEAAAVDFYRAAALAAEQLKIEDWGINAQMLRDRALTGLNELSERGILVETFVPVVPEAVDLEESITPEPVQPADAIEIIEEPVVLVDAAPETLDDSGLEDS
jgi:hypothetical protein